jgi:adenylate cyclase
MLDALAEKRIIEKKRYNAGLIVAEVELESEGQAFRKPEWVGEEVTADPRYFNSNLIKHPYTRW